ncbi:hypothetical protein PAMP_012582 [Pampus punctatissimus]
MEKEKVDSEGQENRKKADREARRRGRRFPRFTPRQRRQGEQGPRGWNIPSEPATGTNQAATGSSERREKQRRGPAPYPPGCGRSNPALSLTRQPLRLPRRQCRFRRGENAEVRQRHVGMSSRKGGKVLCPKRTKPTTFLTEAHRSSSVCRSYTSRVLTVCVTSVRNSRNTHNSRST